MNVAMKFLVFATTVAIVCSAYDMDDDESDMNQPCGGQPGRLTSRIHPDLPSNGFPSQGREYQGLKADSTVWKYKKGEWCFHANSKDGATDDETRRIRTPPRNPQRGNGRPDNIPNNIPRYRGGMVPWSG